MKIEIGENLGITVVLIVAILSLTIVGMHGCSEVEKSARFFTEKGLVQKPLPGTTATHWTTP